MIAPQCAKGNKFLDTILDTIRYYERDFGSEGGKWRLIPWV